MRILVLAFLLISCSQTPIQTPERPDSYLHLLDRNTRQSSAYTGINNVFEVRATLMSSELTRTQVELLSQDFQWSSIQKSEEMAKKNQELSSRTTVFLSFFAGDTSTDDLMAKDSIWRIFLDVGNKRYVGTIDKLRTPFAELNSLFPAHTKWNTPYVLYFPIPTSAVEGTNAKLTITGPLASTELVFASPE